MAYKKFNNLAEAIIWYMYKGCDSSASVAPISPDIRALVTGVEEPQDVAEDTGEYIVIRY